MSLASQAKFERWTLQDELRFINNIGSFAGNKTPAINTVETLLNRYRKALAAREGLSFDKTQALMLIDHRLQEIAHMRLAALSRDLSDRVLNRPTEAEVGSE